MSIKTSAVSLTDAQIAVIKASLSLNRESLVRYQRKEIPGSEMHSVRTRQISEIDELSKLFFFG